MECCVEERSSRKENELNGRGAKSGSGGVEWRSGRFHIDGGREEGGRGRKSCYAWHSARKGGGKDNGAVITRTNEGSFSTRGLKWMSSSGMGRQSPSSSAQP